MKLTYLRDERGVAMLLELVLLVAVLSLAGLAVYQASNRSQVADTQTETSIQPDSPEGLANSAAAIVEAEAAGDAATSAEAEAMAAELEASEADVTNLGGSADGSF